MVDLEKLTVDELLDKKPQELIDLFGAEGIVCAGHKHGASILRPDKLQNLALRDRLIVSAQNKDWYLIDSEEQKLLVVVMGGEVVMPGKLEVEPFRQRHLSYGKRVLAEELVKEYNNQ